MVYLHTGPMGVHRACFFTARAGRAATPERNRSGNQPPILCILPLVAHQLASAWHFSVQLQGRTSVRWCDGGRLPFILGGFGGMRCDERFEFSCPYRIAGIEEMPGIRPAAFLSSYFFPGKGMREWTLDRRPGKWIVNEKLPPRKCRAGPNKSSFR